MAAVNLSSVVQFPRSRVISGIGTTWQEVNLPTIGRCKRLSVRLSAAGKVAFSGDDSGSSPADGGAVGTHYQPADASTWLSWDLPEATAQRNLSVFIAADTGTLTAYLSLEG